MNTGYISAPIPIYYLAGEKVLLSSLILLLGFLPITASPVDELSEVTTPVMSLKWICPSKDGSHFVCDDSDTTFVVWGFNYDHDATGRLLEDYWTQEWQTVVEDFYEMKQLGANVVRIHLQLAKFIKSPQEVDHAALAQLARLVQIAERTGLYLDITGLGCYHRQDVPQWYNVLSEAKRWEVQALFWEAIARVCAKSPAIFCYDLMNEPILPDANQKETDWLAGEFGGKWFAQRITLDLRGRTQKQVARQWVDKLVATIRKVDNRHMITIGAIPLAFAFPGAKPLFYSPEVSEALDFVSVHFYPETNKVNEALTALATYNIGKPLVVEELFPLRCSVEDLDVFIEGSRRIADGWIGFYWGKTIEEYAKEPTDIAGAITRHWLEYFRTKTPAILGSPLK
ncbi:MAG: glycoside hydrolase family 5 protein [Candidatus Sumerlaeia bacterium]|nr:glycoside hydrolase family 5 protein [Candidatus Sumerlaeia bacterium]